MSKFKLDARAHLTESEESFDNIFWWISDNDSFLASAQRTISLLSFD